MKKVILYSKMFQKGFSGGRYHAMFLMESFASLGFEVTILCQEMPGFISEFENLPDHETVKFVLDPDFILENPEEKFDLIVLCPDRSNEIYYERCIDHARATKTPLILINFESGNWFNSLSPQKLDLKFWDSWIRASREPGVVLSSANESMKWAKEFYTDVPDKSIFDVWSPPINSLAADKFIGIDKENSITTITRFGDKHKGAEDFCSLVSEEFKGTNINLISGREITDKDFPDGVLERAKELDISFTYLQKLSDEEKFEIIAKSKVFVFPSYFEGYGYPPLECLYVNTPVVVYDLPVIRETAGHLADKGIFFVPRGDLEQLKVKVAELFHSQKTFETHQEIYNQTNYFERLEDLKRKVSDWLKVQV